jgi:gamma-tubulin complex component 2
VLSKSTIAKYQALFKHLFRAKVMEKKVCETWATLRRLHKKMHRRQQQQSSSRMEYENPTEEHFLTRDVFVHANAAHWTAQRAISLIQNVLHYATSEVIEPNWATMESEIFSSSTSADDVIKAHAKFLETTARESMLLRPTLLNLYESILQSCSKLCDACEDFERNDEEEEAKLRVAGDYDDREDQMEDFLHRIEFISSEFDERTAAFIDALKDAARFESKFESLISRVEPLEQSNSRY